MDLTAAIVPAKIPLPLPPPLVRIAAVSTGNKTPMAQSQFARMLNNFGTLSEAEQELLESYRRGESYVVAKDRPRAEEKWAGNTVRAGFLRFLIVGDDNRSPANEQSVSIQGAWIEGELDLQGATTTGDFVAFSCWFDERPNLRDARIKGNLILSCSRVHGLRCSGLVCDGGFLSYDLASDASVDLSGSTIGRNLIFAGATLSGDLGDDSLSARRIKVGGDVVLDKCTASGTVRLSSATIGGDLLCRSATLRANFGDSIAADGIQVKGDIVLDQGFTANGTVSIPNATIGGNLECADAMLNGPIYAEGLHGVALEASKVVVKKNVFLTDTTQVDEKMLFIANGTVSLRGATISGNLACTGAQLNGPADANGPRGVALDASGMVVHENVLLDCKFQDKRIPFTANGTVSLIGATISGDLDCTAASLRGPVYEEGSPGAALQASNIVVKGNVVFCGMAVFMEGAFREDMTTAFTVDGFVSLAGATISGNLECARAAFTPSNKYNSLYAERLTVSGFFVFGPFSRPVGKISLEFAHVRILADDENAWGEGLNLHQFTYDVLLNRFKGDVAIRLAWLDKQLPELSGKDGDGRQFRPQPWRQLRNAYSEAGYAADSREVAIKFEHRRRHCGQITGVAWVLHLIYGFFTSYGYRPQWLLYWSIGVWLSCAALYDYDAYRNKFAPADSSIYEDPSCRAAASAVNDAMPANQVFTPPCGGNYPTFSPLVYSLNVFLPIIELGQETAWAPATKPFSRIWWQNLVRPFTEPASFLQLVIWLETLLGWIAGLLLVAVVSGLARKQDDS